MCKVYSVTSQKGGTAKTTTVFNFGAYLAGKGYRVLLIDTDPQGSLTASLGFGNPDEMDVTIANVMEKEINDENYDRIETLDRDTGEIEGGFMAVVNAALALILDMRPDEIDTVDLIGVLNKSNPKAYELFSFSLELTKGLPIPEIYKINPDNYICLYRKEEYERFKDNLKRINEIVTETTNNLFMLILKKMNLRDDELVYKDSYQVVIDRNTYLKHNDNKRFELFD